VPFSDKVGKYFKADRSQMTIWRIGIACWIPKATNTQSEYEIHFSTATVVSRNRLTLTLHVRWLFCYGYAIGL